MKVLYEDKSKGLILTHINLVCVCVSLFPATKFLDEKVVGSDFSLYVCALCRSLEISSEFIPSLIGIKMHLDLLLFPPSNT